MKNLLFPLLVLAMYRLPAQQWQWLSRIDKAHYPANYSALAPNGKLYVAMGPYFHEVSANGATLAANNYTGNGLEVLALQVNSKGNLVFGGYVLNSFTLAGQQWNTGGSTDIFVAEFNQQYQAMWSHVIGGPGYQELSDLGLDKNDNIYFTGVANGNFNFIGKQLACRQYGSGYVAKLDAASNLAWVHADSSDNAQSEGKHITVTENGMSLVSIDSKHSSSYYYFNHTPLYPGTSSYNYGDIFALLLRPDGSVLQARSDQRGKWSNYTFVGLNTSYWHRLEEGAGNGDYFSGVQEYSYACDTMGAYSGNVLDPDDNYTKYLGVIDGKTYFLCSYSYYTPKGKQFENYISVFEQHQMNHLVKFPGTVHACHLHKRNDGVFIFDGIFKRKLSLGPYSLTTPFVNMYGTDSIFADHTFVAALNLNATVDMTENSKSGIRVYPNPAKDRLFVTGCDTGASVVAVNVIGQRTACAMCEHVIDVSQLSAGVYFVEMVSDRRRSTIRFIKE